MRHVSAEQVRWWLDDNAIQDVTEHTEEETEFNLQVTLSRLPIHVIKEDERGPLRIVGRNGFDTERSSQLLRDESRRRELLQGIGPMLAATPGFYTFLDEAGRACEFRNAHALQIEHRIYPNEATQQALMDSVMAIATGMRYAQNVVVALHPAPMDEDVSAESPESDEREAETGNGEQEAEAGSDDRAAASGSDGREASEGDEQ